MSLTFPNSPSTNDTHVTGGSTWIFNGEMWVRQGTRGAQGLQGTQGTQGLQGLQGNQGTQGTQGLQGRQGTQGLQGLSNQGVQGLQGLQGLQGVQGLKGNQGVQGTLGRQGLQGLQGNQGVQGLQGNQGVQGLQGNQGVQGLQGLQGVQGLQGLSNQGVQGLQGLMGIQGRQGVQGTDGADGNFGGATFDYTFDTSTGNSDPGTGKLRLNNSTVSSATALYIDVEDDNGTDISSFLTTIDDSTSTIKGHFRISNRLNADDFALFTISSASSEQGAYYSVSCGYVSGSASSFSNSEDVIITFARTGDKGDTGATGSQGVQGLQGLKGSQGVQGLSNQGVQGLQGILGTAGSAGANGAQGTTGTAGSNGSNGSNGAQGTAGTAAGGGIGVDYDDNIKVRFGDDNDLEIYHDGTHSYIHENTGNLRIESDSSNNNDIQILNNNTTAIANHSFSYSAKFISGGSVELYEAGSKKLETTSAGVDITGDLTLTDTDAGSSAGPELKLYRNSASPADADYLGQIKFAGESDTGVERNYAKITGKISDASNGTEDGIIEFAHIKAGSQNISGRWNSTELQLLNGTHLSLGDSQEIRVGASDDLTIYHDGSNSYIKDTGTGRLLVNTSGFRVNSAGNTENMIHAEVNGAVELYYDNDLHFATTSLGCKTNGDLSFRGDGDVEQILFDASDASLKFTDNKSAKFGDGDDLKIYHDGSINRIRFDVNTVFEKNDSTDIATFLPDGAVTLFHNGTARLETTSDGAKITGGLQDKDGQLGSSGQVLSSTGTALNWVDADSGPQGVQGLKGNNGSNGSNGAQGTQGEQGATGLVDNPYGGLAAYGSGTESNVSYDSTEDALKLYSASDNTIGVAFPAFRVNLASNETHKLSVKFRSSNASGSGIYIRVYEYNAALPSDKLAVSNNANTSSTHVQEDTSGKTNWYENGAVATTWTTSDYTYTPTAGAVWASIVVLNWIDHGTNDLFIRDPFHQLTGSSGAQGIAGSDGTNGSNGSNGSHGAQGTAGSAGSNGSTGSNGAQGTAGSATLTNVSNNRIMTAVSGTTLNAEANLNWDGSSLIIGGNHSNNHYNSVSSTRMSFGGGNDINNYFIGTNLENFGGNYTKLDLRWHTGIRMGAQASYGGVRIYNNEDLSTLLFSIGKSDGNTRVESGNLIVAGTVTANSDIKLKKNITTIDNALDKVCKLRGVEFDYIENEKHNIGVIAQEVEEVLPEVVIYNQDDIKSVAYGNLTAVLIEAVKELKKENDALSARIKSLEDR